MKLYMHPVSTTCRPVMQFIADNNIAMEMQAVDILKGEQYGEGYSKINPNHLVPMLEDGDFRLTESATILRYLADKIGSPAYPKDPKQRARVDERLDWFNSNFYRDWGYNFVYPQTFPHLKYEDAAEKRTNNLTDKQNATSDIQADHAARDVIRVGPAGWSSAPWSALGDRVASFAPWRRRSANSSSSRRSEPTAATTCSRSPANRPRSCTTSRRPPRSSDA